MEPVPVQGCPNNSISMQVSSLFDKSKHLILNFIAHDLYPFQDHLTNLVDDCMLDILSRLDQWAIFEKNNFLRLLNYSDDLDELSTLSMKIRKLSILSRSTAIKIKARKLSIWQVCQPKPKQPKQPIYLFTLGYS